MKAMSAPNERSAIAKPIRQARLTNLMAETHQPSASQLRARRISGRKLSTAGSRVLLTGHPLAPAEVTKPVLRTLPTGIY